MRRQELELRAIECLQRVRDGQRAEGSMFELKASWPDQSQRTARQLAGLANAARGEEVVWIVGVDEDASAVVGASRDDLATWWPGVRKHFADNVCPEMVHSIDLRDDMSGKSVVVLAFGTDAAPYVVNLPSVKGVAADREVPWREGTSTRSATRGQLLKILVPQISFPTVEIIAGDAYVMPGATPGTLLVNISAAVYVAPRQGPIVFSSHRCWAELSVEGGETYYRTVSLKQFGGQNSAGVLADLAGVTVTSPGIVAVEGKGDTPAGDTSPAIGFVNAVVRLVLRTADGLDLRPELRLPPEEPLGKYVGRWKRDRLPPWEY
jgi:hypothetical protein